MPNTANAIPWRQAGARLFHSGCTLAGTGIALGPTALYVHNYRKDVAEVNQVYAPGKPSLYNAPDRSDISPGYVECSEKSRAVEKELKHFGIEKPAMLIMHESFPSQGISFGNGVFGFTREFIDTFDVTHIATVAHEVGHDVAGDTDWRLAVGCLVAPVMFGLAKAAKKLTSRYALVHRPFIQSMLKLPAGVAIAGISYAASQLFKAYQEQRADRYAAEKCTAEELYGQGSFFRHHEALDKRLKELGHEKSAKAIKNLEQSKSSKVVLFACILKKIQPRLEALDDIVFRPLPYRLLTHHPTHLERAEYFEREAAKKEALEKLGK